MTINLTQDEVDVVIDAINYLVDDLDMDNMVAIKLLQQANSKLPKQQCAWIQ